MTTHAPWKVKRMLNSVDESLDLRALTEKSRTQADEIPLEINVEGTRYHLTDLCLVPAITGTMIYTIGEYTEIVEVEA